MPLPDPKEPLQAIASMDRPHGSKGLLQTEALQSFVDLLEFLEQLRRGVTHIGIAILPGNLR